MLWVACCCQLALVMGEQSARGQWIKDVTDKEHRGDMAHP
jgi:hypothetical protein